MLGAGIVAGLVSGSVPAQDEPAHSQGGVEAEIVAVVEQLFTGMRTRDTVLLAQLLDPDAQFVSVRAVDGEQVVRRTSVATFLRSIATAGDTLHERMWQPEVRVDGELATLWAPYDLYIGSRFSHCGYDAFHLVKRNGGWWITAIAYTVRRSPCD